MPGPLGCKLFRSSKVTNNTLRAKVRNHKHSTEEPGAPRPLLENVEEFTTSAGVARFTFVYDFIDSVPYRNETQKIVRTAVAQVTVLDPPATSLYFVYARSTVANSIRARLSRVIFGTEDMIENVEISSDRLRAIIETEAVELKFAWWKGIDTYAQKGALKGNVLKSKYYTAFKKAEPTTIMYESKSTGRTVRLTISGAVTLYGRDVQQAELEDYVTTVVLGD